PEKDTFANLTATREMVVHMVERATVERAVACSAEFPPEVDELAACGFTPVPSEVVRPPRVAEAPVAMECRLRQVVELAQGERGAHLVVADILRYHLDEAVWNQGRLDPDRLDPVGRLAGQSYCTCRNRFEIPRPPRPAKRP
ncbi:MAG: flavin reductase family protein, partial [Nitrospirae bacterium]